jgi:peptidoglycan/xylan/chitin deacetylase (PgdA/CDA1 family)
MASDGATTWYNDKLIDVLHETQTPATLFLSGMWIETHPEISKTLVNDPLFELGNHSYSHPSFAPPCFSLKLVKNDEKPEQITKTQALLKNLTGKDNQYFRFPGGCYSKKDLDLVKSFGLLPIQWNSQGPDSFNTNTKKIVQNLKRLTKNGTIIVLHLDGGVNSPKTAEVVSEYIPWARSQGFEFVKLTNLLR